MDISSPPTAQALPEASAPLEASAETGNQQEISAALWKQIFRFAYSLVGNHAEAEDIAQEAFVALFEENRKQRAVAQVGGWMRTVARRVAYRQFHRVRPDLHVSIEQTNEEGEWHLAEPADSAPSPETRIINETMLRMGARVICSFPMRERQCIMMFFRGYDFAQIAATLGISRWTARRVTLKSIAQLQRKLGRSTR